jgi:predicted TIM-barrel fold metal-dependent hydrolase
MSSRRQFLTSMAVLGTGALASTGLSAQQRGQGGGRGRGARVRAVPPDILTGRRIDVHHHYASPGWVKLLTDTNTLNAVWKGWTPAVSIEAMDKAGVEKSYSSITVPGVYFAEGFGNAAGPRGQKVNNDVRALAREANEFGAKMRADHPGRFGIWASLPLPDVDGSLKEIEYALDKLKLDGIGLLTSIGARYLGDPSFSPVFEELNRRKTIVYTHPEAGPCCVDAVPNVGPTTLEYSHDTARTIVSWVESGSAARFPNVQMIFSHAGGSLWIDRYIGTEIGTQRKPFENPAQPPAKLSILRRFYYDTAMSTNFVQLQALKTIVGASRIVFGTDCPYAQPLDIALDLREMQMDGVFTAAEMQGINRDNILKVLPKA